MPQDLKQTPLAALHREWGAKPLPGRTRILPFVAHRYYKP